MIPAPFEYELATSVENAIELLGQSQDAKLLAGGHSLLPLMRLRFARPGTLVDIGRLAELRYVREDGDRIAIGALTRHHDLERDPILAQHCGIVSYAAGLVGDPQVRHRGTIGGSAAHGDPASDLPTVLLCVDAEFVVRGPEGDRTVAAADFFTGVFETALGPRDVLTEIRVPKLTGGFAYEKFNRRAQDWATVGIAAVASNGGAKVALTSMGATPLRASAVEQALAGGASPAEAAEKADEGTEPPSDTNGSADFRRHLARVLTRRALEQALRPQMSAEDNKALVRRFYAEIDAGNLKAMDELVADDQLDHSPPPFPGLASGREGLKQSFEIFWKVILALRATLER